MSLYYLFFLSYILVPLEQVPILSQIKSIILLCKKQFKAALNVQKTFFYYLLFPITFPIKYFLTRNTSDIDRVPILSQLRSLIYYISYGSFEAKKIQYNYVNNYISNLDLDVPVEKYILEDNSIWMKGLPNNTVLSDVVFPGSHNSSTKVIYGIYDSLAICQEYSVYEQLKAGIRYLDIRICDDTPDNEVWVSHTFLSCKLKDVLVEIASFLSNYKSEIVLLDITTDYNRKLSNPQKLNTLLDQFLGGMSMTDYEFRHSMYIDLVNANKRVYYCDNNISTYPILHTSDPDDAIYRVTRFSKYFEFKSTLYPITLLSLIITPTTDSVISGFTTLSLDTIRKRAYEYHKLLLSEWSSVIEQKYNIISHDFINPTIVSNIIKINV
jgi:hypothetical protein